MECGQPARRLGIGRRYRSVQCRSSLGWLYRYVFGPAVETTTQFDVPIRASAVKDDIIWPAQQKPSRWCRVVELIDCNRQCAAAAHRWPGPINPDLPLTHSRREVLAEN